MTHGTAVDGVQEAEAKKCLVPSCESIGTRRGLCSSCRNAAKREVEAGRTTDAELIERGLLLAKGRKGRLAAALEDRRNKKDGGDNVSDRKSATVDAATSG